MMRTRDFAREYESARVFAWMRAGVCACALREVRGTGFAAFGFEDMRCFPNVAVSQNAPQVVGLLLGCCCGRAPFFENARPT